MKNFAIKIQVGQTTYRYSTDALSVRETIGGQEFVTSFLPYVEKLSPLTSAIDLEGTPSVPTVSVKVWDAHRDINEAFKDLDYESIEVTFYTVDEQGNIEASFTGFMVDVSFEGGMTSFSIRTDEDEALDNMMTAFTHYTFQKVQVLVPKDVKLYGEWEILEETPWVIEHINKPKARVRYATGVGATVLHLRRKDNAYGHQTFGEYEGEVVYLLAPDLLFLFGGSDAAVAARNGLNDLYPDRVTLGLTNHNFAIISSVIKGENDRPDPSSVVFSQIIAYDEVITLDGTIMLRGIPTTGPYSIKYPVLRWAVVAPVDMTLDSYSTSSSGEPVFQKVDRLFVRSNGLVPVSPTSSKIGYGFIDLNMAGNVLHVEETGTGLVTAFNEAALNETGEPSLNLRVQLVQDRVVKTKTKVFHRFSISSIIYDGDPNNPLLAIDVHSRYLDKRTPFRLGVQAGPAFAIGSYEMPVELKIGAPVKIVDFRWVVGEMEFRLPEMDEDTRLRLLEDVFEAEESRFKGRLRGSRIDMIENFSDLVTTFATGEVGGDHDYSELNNNLVNNATGKFAVATDSELVIQNTSFTTDEFSEKVTFRLQPFIENVLPIATVVSGGLVTEWSTVRRPTTPDSYMNYMTYMASERERPLYPSLISFPSITPSDAGYLEAREYFLSNLYRVLHNPVPENAADLGKFFPIVYGTVEKVPMVHVISKKTMQSDGNNTAGDDVYIYASHPCSVKTPYDIKIELIDEADSDGEDRQKTLERDYLPVTRTSMVKSPFPNYLSGHHEVDRTGAGADFDEEGNLNPESFRLRDVGNIYHPYHNIGVFQDTDRRNLYGVKLRGSEWKYQAGYLDKRYAIRNGVGSSPLYASFSGWEDRTGLVTGRSGSLVEHHLDIVAHYIRTYGSRPVSLDAVDVETWHEVRGKTPKLTASVYMNEGPMKFSEMLKSMSEQFGTLWYMKGSKIYFARPDLEIVDYSKPIADGLNLLIGISEQSEGYKKIYNEVVYSYGKDWQTGNFTNKIILNSENNFYCSQADKARTGKETIKIDATFVTSHRVAIECANYIARLRCSRKALYSLEVKYTEGINFKVGDYIPLTSKVLGMTNVPVMITSIQEDRDIIVMQVVRFFNLL